MNRVLSVTRVRTAAALLATLLGFASFANAGSIQQPGLTTGMPEGFGRTEGLYSATVLDFGVRSTDPHSTQTVAIPTFFILSTAWDIGNAHVSFKAAPLVGVSLDAPGLNETNVYSPYASVWLSWFLGNGLNLSLGEGAQIGVRNDLTKAIGRDFTAFQQNVALSYVKNNWNVTGNAFYTMGRTRDTGSQPDTLNLDFTAIKRHGRKEYGAIAFGQWDLNSPSVGYLGEGKKQSEYAVGGLFGYIVGNLVQVQAKLTMDVYQKNLGGYEPRLWLQVILPVWTPRAPTPRHAP
jgi:hypothetical protein